MRVQDAIFPSVRIFTLVAVVSMFAGSSFATGAIETTLYSFLGSPTDGFNPNAALVADSAGNLYGTTVNGGTDGACGCGTVFELSPPATAGAAWTETVLYSFQGGTTDGAKPQGTLIFDSKGNLYGTTQGGLGTVFELSPPVTAGGSWTETNLYFFPRNLVKGYNPSGKLVFDAAGNLYGTALSGGTGMHCGGGPTGCGVVFRLNAPATEGGAWSERVLYSFGSVANDGYVPSPDLVLRNGSLYGMTAGGGTTSNGTVFQIVNNAGVWSENILYNFTSAISTPRGSLAMNSAGNLFGMTNLGGNQGTNCNAGGCGVIFELSPPTVAGDPWQETTLYSFLGKGDGGNPYSTPFLDSLGDIYGTASQGGKKNTEGIGGPTCGTVFKLKAPATTGGAWTLVVLHDFGGLPVGDGNYPLGALALVHGTFYGTTFYGGNEDSNGGTVFSVVP